MKEIILIRGYGSISSLGHNKETIRHSYQSGKTGFQVQNATPVGTLQTESEIIIEQLIREKKAYQGLDRSVILALYASRQAVANAGWMRETNISVNIGSSRGATSLFEKYITEFNTTGAIPPHTSPVTTLGNISSWVAQDLNTYGPTISHSVTCSTGLQAIANAFAWLKSGMADKFLAGASEAPLTPFTIAQMKALGIYSDDVLTPYPCRPFNELKKNTFVLGEGAAVFALERISNADYLAGTSKPVCIESVGFGFENISSKTGISREGTGFKMAIVNALKNAESDLPIDMVVMHSPGTLAGDYAELNAIQAVFPESEMPILTSTKWMMGHTLGASGCLSLDYAIYVLQSQSYSGFPYPATISTVKNRPIKRILITAAGFGGNAAAIIVSN